MLWDLAEGKRLYNLDAGEIIYALCFSPNRYWLCAATTNVIKVRRRATQTLYSGPQILALSIHADPLGDMHRSPTQKSHPTLYVYTDTNGVDVYLRSAEAHLQWLKALFGQPCSAGSQCGLPATQPALHQIVSGRG